MSKEVINLVTGHAGEVTDQYVEPTNGQSVQAEQSPNTTVIIDPAGTLATLTIVLPSSPVNGDIVTITTSQIITALTITGTIIGTLTTLSLGAFARFKYVSAAGAWFRIG